MHLIPRKYTTENVNAGGVEVQVRQTLGSYNKDTPGQVKMAVESAQQWLRDAMQEVVIASAAAEGHESEWFVERFKYCFQADPSKRRIFEVSGVLDKIKNGLSHGPLGIKVWDMRGEGALGYVRAAYVFEDGEIDLQSRGEIHLDRKLLSDPKKAPLTLIHEAGHKFANRRDIAYVNYTITKGNPYMFEIDWDDTSRNADSYAMFVFRLSRTQLNPRLVAEAKASAAPAGKGLGAAAAGIFKR